MTRVLIGVRGLSDENSTERVLEALGKIVGVSKAVLAHPGQVEVHYDPANLTIMDLIRVVRTQGFLAGML